MNGNAKEKSARKDSSRFDWMIELAIFATISPAIIYGLMSLENLPLVA